MGSMLKTKRTGFTMVELLVVLVIVAILAAVAAPIYLANTRRSKASEAVATMSLIRQAERDYNLRNGSGYKAEAYSAAVPAAGIELDLNIYAGTNQYFTLNAFEVRTTNLAWHGNITPGVPGNPVDFVIEARGSLTNPCEANETRCAVKGSDTDVQAMCLQMDNSGRIFVSYNSPACAGGTWEAY